MALKLYEESSVRAIAQAIRSKNEATTRYKICDMAEAIEQLNISGVFGRYTHMATGTVTYATSNHSNGDDVIAELADIDFEPKIFFCIMSQEGSESVTNALIAGTVTDAVWCYCSFVTVSVSGEGEDRYRRQTGRFNTSGGALGGPAVNNTNWSISTNDYIKKTDTYIAFRRTAGYGHEADIVYEWYALGE